MIDGVGFGAWASGIWNNIQTLRLFLIQNSLFGIGITPTKYHWHYDFNEEQTYIYAKVGTPNTRNESVPRSTFFIHIFRPFFDDFLCEIMGFSKTPNIIRSDFTFVGILCKWFGSGGPPIRVAGMLIQLSIDIITGFCRRGSLASTCPCLPSPTANIPKTSSRQGLRFRV